MKITKPLNNSSMEFVYDRLKKTKIKSILFGLSFWCLTVFSLLFTAFSSFMGTTKLASSRFSDSFKSFTNLFVITVGGKTVDQWPIFVLWIGVGLSLTSGVLALFFVKKRWVSNLKAYNLLQLELRLYKIGAGEYANIKRRNFLLFKNINELLGTNTHWGDSNLENDNILKENQSTTTEEKATISNKSKTKTKKADTKSTNYSEDSLESIKQSSSKKSTKKAIVKKTNTNSKAKKEK